MDYLKYINLPANFGYINYPKYNYINYPKNKYEFEDEKKYTLTEKELMKIFELLNKLNEYKSNETKKPREPSEPSEPIKQTKSTQTNKFGFSLKDAYKQFDKFMEKKQNETSKPFEIPNDNIGNSFEKGTFVEKANFVGWNYSKCEARFKELEVQYNQMCNKLDELLDFTTEEEAKIKQEYMELKEKLFNWIE